MLQIFFLQLLQHTLQYSEKIPQYKSDSDKNSLSCEPVVDFYKQTPSGRFIYFQKSLNSICAQKLLIFHQIEQQLYHIPNLIEYKREPILQYSACCDNPINLFDQFQPQIKGQNILNSELIFDTKKCNIEDLGALQKLVNYQTNCIQPSKMVISTEQFSLNHRFNFQFVEDEHLYWNFTFPKRNNVVAQFPEEISKMFLSSKLNFSQLNCLRKNIQNYIPENINFTDFTNCKEILLKDSRPRQDSSSEESVNDHPKNSSTSDGDSDPIVLPEDQSRINYGSYIVKNRENSDLKKAMTRFSKEIPFLSQQTMIESMKTSSLHTKSLPI